MNKLGTVISFTMRNKLRNKAFVITTVVLMLLVIVGGNVPYLIDKLSGDKAAKVGYIEGQQAEIIQGLRDYYGKIPEADVELVSVPSAGSADADVAKLKEMLSDKDIKGYLSFTDNPVAGFPSAIYHSKSAFASGTAQSLTASLQAVKTDLLLKDAGLTEDQKLKLLTPIELGTQKVSLTDESGKTEEEQGTAIAVMYAVIILLFMSVMISGQLIATEITAEKSSRVMEIIVTSVKPLTQMWGKIIGTFIVAIVQIAVIVGALVVNLNLPHNKEAFAGFGIRLDAVNPIMLVYAVVFFLAGFFLYATLFAAVGSIVSRTEDLGQAVLPITLITVVGFYIAMYGLTNPDSPLIVICSYIPFFSPFLMVLRVGLGEPAVWEPFAAFGLLIVTILFIGWLSAKIYRAGVLMYGKKPSMKDLVKAMKAYKV